MSIRDQLVAIHAAHGYLTPAIVVDTARPADHPLHDHFEWDNSVAGEEWRKHQAHQLIRSVKIKYNGTNRPTDVRAFVAVPQPDSHQPHYEPTEQAMADPVISRLVLLQMEREWKTLQARYGDLAEFTEMIRRDLGDAA